MTTHDSNEIDEIYNSISTIEHTRTFVQMLDIKNWKNGEYTGDLDSIMTKLYGMSNLQAFTALIDTYRSITIYQLTNDEFDGLHAMEAITGFGSRDTCSLCKQSCRKCVYFLAIEQSAYACVDETYDHMSNAGTPTELFNAIQVRIAYMEDVIEKFIRQFFNGEYDD